MLFNSWQFAIFFPLVFFFYYNIPHKYRWIMLLVASYYFYMCWKPELVILILFVTAVNYITAIGIASQKGIWKRFLLLTSIVISLGILVFFKYFNFFSISLATVLRCFSISFEPVVLNLILPMGISFYTFQAISYTIDVYKGQTRPEKHFGYFALFISFFPQLVAGPIEKSQYLLPQLKQEHKFDYWNVTYGLKLMAIGFFKKMVVADTLAKGVNRVYNNVQEYSGLPLLAATIMFAFQIYCDFSGYSDIAKGCAKTMGINLMQNFRSPYFARSFQEFWNRWHISLSTWFKEYVYIPLGGNRVTKKRHYFNLMTTFLLSGLWHGASWTFVLWGGLHGLYQILERVVQQGFFKKRRNTSNMCNLNTLSGKLRYVRDIGITFTGVCFSWIFFRANTMKDAVYIIKNIFAGISSPILYVEELIKGLELSKQGCLLLGFQVSLLIGIDLAQARYDVIDRVSKLALPLRWGIYLAFTSIIAILSTKGTIAEFIYFQF